jgi:hypothetical protein
MLKSKAYNKKLTATYCTTSNTLFVHDAKIDAHKVYSTNNVQIIRNLTSTQQSAFYMLPATYLQKAKAKYFTSAERLQQIYKQLTS